MPIRKRVCLFQLYQTVCDIAAAAAVQSIIGYVGSTRRMLLKRSRKKGRRETYPPVKYLPFTVDESRRTASLKKDKREKGIFFPDGWCCWSDGRRNFSPLIPLFSILLINNKWPNGAWPDGWYIYFRLNHARFKAFPVCRVWKMEKWEARVLSAALSAPVIFNSVKASAV